MSMNPQLNPTSEPQMLDARPVAPSPEQLRANTYSLLGTLLAWPPGLELLEVLRGIDGSDGIGEGTLAPAWQMLKLAAREADAARVDDEFHDLFIGVGRGELVPYGSWYLTGFMMDKPLALLRADLAALGFERQPDVHEPEDHVAALCEAMAAIIVGDDIDPEAERRFFGEHVGPWMGQFFNDLQQARAACFYRAVGRLGQEFLAIESRYQDMSA